ncbi:MAG: universal stress protein [Gammaproteobacteria bacterium]
MEHYKHILLAVDLHPDCETTTDHALTLAKEHHAKLSIVHAIEHINVFGLAQAYPTVFELQKEMVQHAQDELAKFKTKFHLEDANMIVEIGSPKIVILEQAQKLGVDLIIVGSHGRHGIGLLLGSTANAVLHHAPCDVLAVRVK